MQPLFPQVKRLAALVLAGSLLALPGQLRAADAPSPYTLTLYWENDGTFAKPNHRTDEHYTNGGALSLAHQPDWAEELAPHMPFAGAFGPADTGAGYILGQLMFTPRDIGTPDLIEEDRPYAGYLFGGVYWQRRNDHTLDHFQLDVGIVGPSSLAGEIQREVHEASGTIIPRGWDNQIRDEPTIQAYIRKKWRLATRQLDLAGLPLEGELIPQVGLALGTVYRHLEGGLTARLGVNLPDDFGPGRLHDPAAATGAPASGWSLYGFTRLGGQAVEHNLLLEGNTHKHSHGVDPEPLVGEIQLGLVVAYRQQDLAVELGYSQTYRTHTFEHQQDGDAFGAYTLAITREF